MMLPPPADTGTVIPEVPRVPPSIVNPFKSSVTSLAAIVMASPEVTVTLVVK